MYEEERVNYYVLLYSEDLKAKLYKLNGSKYEKVVDLLEGEFIFDDIKCKAKIDFDFVFDRFKK